MYTRKIRWQSKKVLKSNCPIRQDTTSIPIKGRLATNTFLCPNPKQTRGSIPCPAWAKSVMCRNKKEKMTMAVSCSRNASIKQTLEGTKTCQTCQRQRVASGSQTGLWIGPQLPGQKQTNLPILPAFRARNPLTHVLQPRSPSPTCPCSTQQSCEGDDVQRHRSHSLG